MVTIPVTYKGHSWCGQTSIFGCERGFLRSSPKGLRPSFIGVLCACNTYGAHLEPAQTQANGLLPLIGSLALTITQLELTGSGGPIDLVKSYLVRR
jgi:hypothetical protein